MVLRKETCRVDVKNSHNRDILELVLVGKDSSGREGAKGSLYRKDGNRKEYHNALTGKGGVTYMCS